MSFTLPGARTAPAAPLPAGAPAFTPIELPPVPAGPVHRNTTDGREWVAVGKTSKAVLARRTPAEKGLRP